MLCYFCFFDVCDGCGKCECGDKGKRRSVAKGNPMKANR